MNGMTNTPLLEITIALSGKNKKELAGMLGISEEFFQRKINGYADFMSREAQILMRELRMSEDVAKYIFFNAA